MKNLNTVLEKYIWPIFLHASTVWLIVIYHCFHSSWLTFWFVEYFDQFKCTEKHDINLCNVCMYDDEPTNLRACVRHVSNWAE